MRRAVLVPAALAALAVAGNASAQADSARVRGPLFVHSDLYVLAFYTAGTLAMFPLDRHLASVVRDEDLVANRDLERVSSVFRFFGGPGPYLIGAGMYVVGRAAKVPRAARLGLHGTEAVIVAQTVAGVLKVGLGRARPYTSADTNPRNFRFARGLHGTAYQSFPSGHSTSAFAAAAAVYSETVAWWPRRRWLLAPVLYGGAALVGVSRIYEDKHWASDVLMGAAIGTFAGLKVVRFNQTHEGNRIDRMLLGTSADAGLRGASDASGVRLTYRIAW